MVVVYIFVFLVVHLVSESDIHFSGVLPPQTPMIFIVAQYAGIVYSKYHMIPEWGFLSGFRLDFWTVRKVRRS